MQVICSPILILLWNMAFHIFFPVFLLILITTTVEIPQSNSWSLSEVFAFSDFLHGEFWSLMTCSHSPPRSQASPLLTAVVKHSCTAPSGWPVDRIVSLDSELTTQRGFGIRSELRASVRYCMELAGCGPQEEKETSILTPDHQP